MRTLFACLIAAALLTRSYGHAPAYDRPVHSICICLTACAALLILVDRYCPQHFRRPVPVRASQGHGIGLQDLDLHRDSSQEWKSPPRAKRWISSQQPFLIVAGIILLTARIELSRQISSSVQCTTRSYAVFLPLLLALYDSRQQPRVSFIVEDQSDEDLHDGIFESIRLMLVKPTWRFVPAAFLLSASSYAVTNLWQSQTSTHICPIVSGHAILVPRLQQLSLVLDLVLVVTADKLCLLESRPSVPPLSIPKAYGLILFGTTCCWVGVATVFFLVRPEYRSWLFLLDLPSEATYLFSVIWQLLLFGMLITAATDCIIHYGVLVTSAFLMATLTVVPGLSLVYYNTHPFPPISASTLLWAFPCILISLWMIHMIRQGVSTSPAPLWRSWMLIPILLLIFIMSFGLLKKNYVHFHPIELLMYDAKDQHNRYLQYAHHSKDLRAAISVYQGRYESEPPPGFDVWWEFARNKSVIITDDFDQIHLDLLPFRTVTPADLRRQTWEMVSNPWNEISGISIRNGNAEIQSNAAPTHRWMLEGVGALINSFARHLPDMDLAFNLNDECRIAVPYDDITAIMRKAEEHPLNGRSAGSQNRSADWIPVAEGAQYQESAFENWSFQNTYTRFGSAGCSQRSPARSKGRRIGQAYLCTECAAPHSVSQFVKDWYRAADPCHQPDLADLHGFYSSPAAFKGSRQLLPVFSQSKVHGYNDILYPSAWNYMDKIKYNPSNSSGTPGTEGYVAGHPDPSFAEKENKLYWRGATTEGVSAGNGVWQGMTRQRLVHMFNNLTTSHHDHSTVLLPEPSSDGSGYTYKSLPARSLLRLGLQADVKLVDHIVRCGGRDCTDQEREFGLVGPVDFQEHWRYRYLFDMDGAGFSGRFLPFLESHSLPFKTGLFREWYDSRITAWRHFVPQDIRLHGVWSTLAYFAGVNGIIGGKSIVSEGHIREGELIAEEGRAWAAQALRKEDMEVYFFRLLLEWGRLTDDRRDELGFSLT